jgi:hypothetical protein
VSDDEFKLVPLDEMNAVFVGDVFRSIYDDDFPVKDVYHPETLWREVREGRVAATLAFDGEDRPVGYISLFKSAPNPRLWEGGNLIVNPAYKHTYLSSILFRHYLKPEIREPLHADGFFGEAVCHHYFTQVGCVKSGMADCAIELDLLDGASFKDNQAGSGRVACVLNFLEFTRPDAPVYLPQRYAEIVQRLSKTLFPRSFLPADSPLPLDGVSQREDRYHEAARTWKVYVREIGGDWRVAVDELLREADSRDVVSLQVTLNTANPHLGSAVEIMRGRGFFLGGLAPRWFGNDGLLMQKVLGREPDYDGIKLYSRTAKDLLTTIRADREETSRLAGRGVSA